MIFFLHKKYENRKNLIECDGISSNTDFAKKNKIKRERERDGKKIG